MKTEKKKVRVGFGVMLLKDRKILLGKRHEDPKKADSDLHYEGTWTMPGGSLEFGESFEQGAKREVKEETGMTLKDAKVICVNNDKNEYAHFVTIGILSKNFSGTPKVMEPDEITEWKWFASHELPKKIYPPSKKVLENYKAKKFYLSSN